MTLPATPESIVSQNRQEMDQLLDLCRNGDEYAWRDLYARCIPHVSRRLYHLGIPRQDLEDMAQEAMISLTSNIHKVRNPLAFAQKVAYSRAVDHIRKKKPLLIVDRDSGDQEQGASRCPVERKWVEQWIEKARESEDAESLLEGLDLLRSKLKTLGEPCHGLLRLRFFSNRKHAQIATELKVQTQQVGVRINRCIDKLKKSVLSDPQSRTLIHALQIKTG